MGKTASNYPKESVQWASELPVHVQMSRWTFFPWKRDFRSLSRASAAILLLAARDLVQACVWRRPKPGIPARKDACSNPLRQRAPFCCRSAFPPEPLLLRPAGSASLALPKRAWAPQAASEAVHAAVNPAMRALGTRLLPGNVPVRLPQTAARRSPAGGAEHPSRTAPAGARRSGGASGCFLALSGAGSAAGIPLYKWCKNNFP